MTYRYFGTEVDPGCRQQYIVNYFCDVHVINHIQTLLCPVIEIKVLSRFNQQSEVIFTMSSRCI